MIRGLGEQLVRLYPYLSIMTGQALGEERWPRRVHLAGEAQAYELAARVVIDAIGRDALLLLLGRRFCPIGDAACFLDPVFSTGVLMAMTSAELAAETIDHALRSKGRIDAQDFRRFERIYKRGVARFVHGLDEPAMLETFYTKSPNQWIERAVTTALGGGVFFPSFKARFFTLTFQLCVVLTSAVQAVRGRGASSARRESAPRSRTPDASPGD